MALDECEPQMIRALAKDGWQLKDKPFALATPLHNLYVDFSVQKTDITLLVIEVKCFTNSNDDLQNLYTTKGQYDFYEHTLRFLGYTYPLYLALPQVAYERMQQNPVMQSFLKDAKMKLVIVDLVAEVVVQWIH